MRIQSLLLLPVFVVVSALNLGAQTTWLINNTTNIGGNSVVKLGNPQVISTPYGSAIQFNGINDGLIVSNCPLGGMTNMTVEMIFRHDPLTVASAWQPRIVHIQSPNPPDHRLTLETRVIGTNFFLDTFLKFGNTSGYSQTLTNGNFPHAIGDWNHMAITYDGVLFKNYVNGQFELATNITGLTFTNVGNTWIGQRMNNTNYFQGAVLALRFTSRVLSPSEFMNVPATFLNVPAVSNNVVRLNFNLFAGLPASFKLLQADQPTGPWSTNVNAELTTNSPGISYQFATATNGETQFYRVRSP